jgi:hypothetical protein
MKKVPDAAAGNELEYQRDRDLRLIASPGWVGARGVFTIQASSASKSNVNDAALRISSGYTQAPHSCWLGR